MKNWLSIAALLLLSVNFVCGQLPQTQMPSQVTWVQEDSLKKRNGETVQSCNVISLDGENWRNEMTNASADISISICINGKVVSSQQPAPPASPSPALPAQEIFSVLKNQAKYEMVDVVGGIGYSRFKQIGPDGFVRVIWVDRSHGFLHRCQTTYGDGSSRDTYFRKVAVDTNTQGRLFSGNALFPLFGHYLDSWYERLKK